MHVEHGLEACATACELPCCRVLVSKQLDVPHFVISTCKHAQYKGLHQCLVHQLNIVDSLGISAGFQTLQSLVDCVPETFDFSFASGHISTTSCSTFLVP